MAKAIESLSRRILNSPRFLTNLLIPLGVFCLYLVSSWTLLPDGVNRAFVTKSAKIVVPATLLLSAAYLACNGLGGAKRHLRGNAQAESSPRDVILLLLPLTPVTQYIVNNREILTSLEDVMVFGFFLLFSALFVLLVPNLIGHFGSARPLVSLGLGFSTLITAMAALSRQFAWHGAGSLWVQWALMGAITLISYLLLHFHQRSILSLMIAAFFATNLLAQLPSQDEGLLSPGQAGSHQALATLIDDRTPTRSPNIYLLVYDSYVANETLLAHGINNQAQERYLADLGFKIYPRTYSVGSHSVSTMSRVLNMSTSYYGKPRRAVSGDGVVQKLLKGFGYETYGIFPSDFYFRGVAPAYDHSFPPTRSSTSELLIRAILTGEFRFDMDFDDVTRDEFVQAKGGTFSMQLGDPKFVFTHSALPGHSQNSGVCLPDEVQLFAKRLNEANMEMKRDVEMVIENDPRAILVVAGDHGPYLTKNCTNTAGEYDLAEISRLDVQDRFGAFLAIRWPSGDFEAYDDIIVIQDLFPAIFAYMFQDAELLAARMDPRSREEERISGVTIVDGVIKGGIHDGEPLFVGAGSGQ